MSYMCLLQQWISLWEAACPVSGEEAGQDYTWWITPASSSFQFIPGICILVHFSSTNLHILEGFSTALVLASFS